MKREEVKELFRKRSVKIGSVLLAAVIAVSGGLYAWKDSQVKVPELVTFVDSEGSVSVEGEEVPLGVPKVTTSTKTKKKTKKIKMKKASNKTYVQKGKSTTKKTVKTQKTSKQTTTTETVVATSVTTQFKKGSKVKTQVTTTKTTVTKTVLPQSDTATASAVAAVTTGKANAAAATSTAVATAAATPTPAAAAPQVDSRVMNAFNTLGFTITVNSSVSYSGLFDARTRTITLKSSDTTVYHELGHFLAFIAGNYDMSAEFQGIFSREKSKYTEFNKAYVLSNASEYFAESFKNYTMDAASLKASRPETYGAIEKALSNVTDTQVSNIKNIYKAIWGA